MRAMQIKQLGIGLIEVMVALLVLAMALLGYAAMQTKAIKVTDESLQRSQSLVMMGNIAEKIRANPTAVATYATGLNSDATEPATLCGLDGTAVSNYCTPTQLAAAESYLFKSQLDSYGFGVQLHPCPSTGGGGEDAASNIMYSYCLLAAWGDTTPTVAEAATEDDEEAAKNNACIDDKGQYLPAATCMMMEI